MFIVEQERIDGQVRETDLTRTQPVPELLNDNADFVGRVESGDTVRQ